MDRSGNAPSSDERPRRDNRAPTSAAVGAADAQPGAARTGYARDRPQVASGLPPGAGRFPRSLKRGPSPADNGLDHRQIGPSQGAGPSMPASARTEHDSEEVVRTPEQEAAVRAAEVWVNHLARTLKTCRLYDANNPTVIRFREELAQALTRTLEEHGPLTLQFTSDDVLCDEDSLYPARSRDDNLALAFYRDGVRALTFSPGIEPRELERAPRRAAAGDRPERRRGRPGDAAVGGAPAAHRRGLRPGRGRRGRGRRRRRGRGWCPGRPRRRAGVEAAAAGGVRAGARGRRDRSDDWTLGDLAVEVEAGFAELDIAGAGRDRALPRRVRRGARGARW